MGRQAHSACSAAPNKNVRASLLPGLAFLLALCPPVSFAQASPCPAPPPYKYLRYDEDYSYLRDSECRTDPFDKVKFIPLNGDGDVYLSFGGEIRQNVEYFHNAQWGNGPQGPAYSLQRFMGHLDFHWGNRFRFFGQMKSGIEFGRAGGPRVFDKDELAVNQAFVDVGIAHTEKASLIFRAGRQELAYGAARWVSVREGPTVHQSFDAARAIVTVDAWRVDAFLSKPAETNVGVFDDHTDPTRAFWGVYATGPLQKPKSHIDLYYFGLRHSNAKFQQGTAFERRQILGTRIWGAGGAWDYDIEPLAQFGTFGSGHIQAWAIESETGYTLNQLRFSPRFALIASADSGDHGTQDPSLQTFNPLFPRGLYHELVNLTGHANILALNPVATVHFTKELSVTENWEFIWRQSLGDGIYGVGGNFVRTGQSGDGRYVGSQPTAVVNWAIQRHLSLIFIYTHFFPGPFLENTGPHGSVDQISTWLDFKF
jgi:hypothetical protein